MQHFFSLAVLFIIITTTTILCTAIIIISASHALTCSHCSVSCLSVSCCHCVNLNAQNYRPGLLASLCKVLTAWPWLWWCGVCLAPTQLLLIIGRKKTQEEWKGKRRERWKRPESEGMHRVHKMSNHITSCHRTSAIMMILIPDVGLFEFFLQRQQQYNSGYGLVEVILRETLKGFLVVRWWWCDQTRWT